MAKKNVLFFCKECGYEANGWMGKCPACGAWNSFTEAPSGNKSKTKANTEAPTFTANAYSWTDIETTVRLKDAGTENFTRHKTGMESLDRLFGGGITEGSVTLVAGEPGIGKSTILLQLADSYDTKGDVLYVSGEESPAQINMRAERLHIKSNFLICAQTKFEVIAEQLQKIKPALCIIDSIQTLYSEQISGTPGSVTQAREVTAGLIRIAKSNGVPIILVGHITKEGSIAGPKTLEHMVDTVLSFEGDGTGGYRILRSGKNRFGKSGELAFFEMGDRGLSPVDSSQALLVSGRPLNVPGSVLSSAFEGNAALPVEIQALVAESCYANPQRMTSGPDRNRVTMLLAVAEKNLSLGLPTKDCFVNIIGGLKITDPAIDLAIIAAVVSSARDVAVKPNTMILGEVGLSGEIRPVARITKRIAEAARLGLKTVVLPGASKNEVEKITGDTSTGEGKILSKIEFIYADNIREAVDILFA